MAPGAVGEAPIPTLLVSILALLILNFVSPQAPTLTRTWETGEVSGSLNIKAAPRGRGARLTGLVMHLSDKKSENVKLRTEGAQLRTSWSREQATPKEESLVGVPRFAGGGRGTGPGVWFQDLTSPPPRGGSGVHAWRPGPVGAPVPALPAGSS